MGVGVGRCVCVWGGLITRGQVSMSFTAHASDIYIYMLLLYVLLHMLYISCMLCIWGILVSCKEMHRKS